MGYHAWIDDGTLALFVLHAIVELVAPSHHHHPPVALVEQRNHLP